MSYSIATAAREMPVCARCHGRRSLDGRDLCAACWCMEAEDRVINGGNGIDETEWIAAYCEAEQTTPRTSSVIDCTRKYRQEVHG